MNENNLNNGVNPTPVQNVQQTVQPVVNPVVNPAPIVDVTPNGKKSNPLVVILLVLVLIGVCVYGIYSYTDILTPKNKTEEVTTTTSAETTTKVALGSLSKEATSNIETSLNKVFSNTDIVSGKDYLTDYDFKFAFLVNLFGYESINLENGDDGTTGLFTMSVDDFNNLYLKSFGEQFDITKLDKSSTFYTGVKFPTISDNKIHSSFVTGPDPLEYKYSYESMAEDDGLYVLTYMYGFMKENGDNLELQPYGSSYLKLSVDPKGFISYKSFISTK